MKVFLFQLTQWRTNVDYSATQDCVNIEFIENTLNGKPNCQILPLHWKKIVTEMSLAQKYWALYRKYCE